MRLKDKREDSDTKQEVLAKHLHIAQATYSQYENGVRRIPVSALIKLARYFNTSTDYILELTDDPRPYPPSTRKKIENA